MDTYQIITILVFGAIILLFGLIWIFTRNASSNSSSQFNSDLTNMRENMVNDSHLHRLLMIEIVNDKEEIVGENNTGRIMGNSLLPSEIVTFNKMGVGMTLFGKSLVRVFGVPIAQRISTLMQKRNEILRDYYWTLRNMVCESGECSINFQKENDIVTRPVFPPAFLSQEYHRKDTSNNSKNVVLDITTLTERKLEAISREITDQVAGSFNLRDVDQSNVRNRPIVHFQRLFNLITMYDKELVNQAKSYADHHYDISMNCAQSSLEITQHISDEFAVLMRETGERIVKTVP